MTISDLTLWDIAIEQEATKNDDNSEEATLLFVGNKNCGKTSMILRFLDRDEPAKPTIALEYTFGRRAKGHNNVKDIGHIWELGGGTWLNQLISIPLNADTIESFSLVIVLDLSKPNEIFGTFDSLLAGATQVLKGVVDTTLTRKLTAATWQRIGEQHTDKEMMKPFLVPLVIMGANYDIFQDFEPEKRKIISKTLRFLAHTYGAHLMYFSCRHETLISKSRSLFSHLLFRTSLSKSSQFDSNAPLMITAGSDSFQNIGSPPIKESNLGRSSAKTPLDLWRNSFVSQFPQENTLDPSLAEDPAKDEQFKETDIDNLRIKKYTELERYRKVCERQIKEKLITNRKY